MFSVWLVFTSNLNSQTTSGTWARLAEDQIQACKLRSQLEAAHHQHSVLCQHLCRAAANVSLHTILLGVGGTINGPYSLKPLKHLGLDPQKVTKLAVKLHAHSDQYAFKRVSTRCALEKTCAANHHQDQEWGTASHPPDPH